MDIKKDLYYISQNGIIANDKEDLALGKYNNSDKDIQKYIEEVLNKNYVKGTTGIVKIEINECKFIKDISIVKAYTNNKYDVPIIHIDLTIYFKSIINIQNMTDVMKIKLHEDVKASLLKYEEVM